jgi:hypothetical protein
MAKLIYSTIASLDGYVEDASGKFDWAAPDEEVHAFVNDLERPIGTYPYERRMYETMVFWEYAEIWRAAEKVVYSRTLVPGVHRADADRAGLRPGSDPGAQGRAAARTCPSAARSWPRRRSPPDSSTRSSCSSSP